MNHKGHISIMLLVSFITFCIGFSIGSMREEYGINFRVPFEILIWGIGIFLIFVFVGFHIAKNIYDMPHDSENKHKDLI